MRMPTHEAEDVPPCEPAALTEGAHLCPSPPSLWSEIGDRARRILSRVEV